MLCIYREEVFSPNRVEDDAAILSLTADAIRRRGYPVRDIKPEELTDAFPPQVTFGMCEDFRNLRILESWEALGYPVINKPLAVKSCHRWRTLSLLTDPKVPLPRSLAIGTAGNVDGQFDLSRGVWVKRGDVHSTQKEDVTLVFDRCILEEVLAEFRGRQIDTVILQEHVQGDLIKFYGVRGQGWFRCFRQQQERLNGYTFSGEELRRTGEEAAARIGLDVYGGDIVVTRDRHYLIDVNSWPSFAICRQEAAEQIATLIIERFRTWSLGRNSSRTGSQ